MPICRTCGSYHYTKNTTEQCKDCLMTLNYPEFDEEDTLEIDCILNPNGRKQAVFYDEG